MALRDLFSPTKRRDIPGVPFLNTFDTVENTTLFSTQESGRKKRLMKVYKTQPEATAIINTVATDILGSFRLHSKKGSGRNKEQQAQLFREKNDIDNELHAQIIDILVTGEGFAWYKTPNVKEVLDSLKTQLQVKDAQLWNSLVLELASNKQAYDEHLFLPKKYRQVPSTTVDVKYDRFDIVGYTQKVGEKIRTFTPDEIIHLTNLRVDGEPVGFTPLDAIVLQMELLRLMWQNQYALQVKGNHPDKIFVAEDLRENDPAYKKLEQQLKRYNLPYHQHGSLLMTGKIKIEELMKIDNLQYRDVGLYITSLLAMQWSVPASRLPLRTAEASKGTDTSGSNDKAYWRNIERMQDRLARILNGQLWKPYFGVEMVFDKSYLHDEVIENNALQLKLGNIEKTNAVLNQHGKSLSEQKTMQLLGLVREDIVDVAVPQITSSSNQPRMGAQTHRGADGQTRNEQQQEVANSAMRESDNRFGV